MSTLKDIFKKLEESMASAAFAEAGEFETARQLLKPVKNAHKRVLLGTDKAEIDAKTIGYAMRLCQRIGGNLEIFHVLRMSDAKMATEIEQKKDLIDALKAKFGTKGISYQLVMGQDCLADEVLKHTTTRRDLLCVVFDALEAGSSSCLQAKQNMIAKFHALNCPVVVYAESTMA
ncbi:hypothetical protein ACUUL3_16205 [Thiovibrio sp. JS02]